MVSPSYTDSTFLHSAQASYYDKINKWMTMSFTSFSTVLQSHRDGGRMIMRLVTSEQWNPVNSNCWEKFLVPGLLA